MEKIGKYEIIEKLGQGGMGVVYKARDPVIQRIVAIKTISTQLDSDPELRARFFREARSAGQLSHKNIITIYDLGEENGRAYIAMEYLEGEDLRAKIAHAEPLSLHDKVRIMLEVCNALAHAHERQVIHRDIKPGNIFITPTGQVKILDFGLARIESSEITKSGQTLGTPNYMSPEQVKGNRAGYRSDIFSAGTVFYELLTYRKPFEGDSYASIIFKILQDEPMPMQRIDSGIPHELSDIIRKALKKDPEKRYQSSSEMARDLRNVFLSLGGEIAASEGGAMEASVGGRRSEPEPARPLRDSPASNETEARTFPSLSIDSQIVPVLPYPPRSNRKLIYLAVSAVALVALGATVLFITFGNRGKTPSQPAPAATAQVPAKTPPAIDPVVVSGLAEASRLLENRNYSEAAKQAEAILERSPGNPMAQKILVTAREGLDKLTKGNEQAKSLYDAGRYEEAMAALSEVLKIAPFNSEARQLSVQLEKHARKGADDALAQSKKANSQAEDAQQARAENARQAYEIARSRAVEAGAESKAADRFREGSRVAAEAYSRWGRGDFAASRRDFEAATAAMQQAAEAASKAAILAPQPNPADAEAARQAAAAQAGQQQQGNRQAVLILLQRYKSAYENKDLSSLKALWPTLGGPQEKAIQEEFQNARSLTVDLRGIEILFAENQALVTCRRNYQVATLDGRKLQSETRTTLSLGNNGSSWVIEAIRVEALR